MIVIPIIHVAALLVGAAPVPEAYEAEVPRDRPAWSARAAALGKKLFHEGRLSRSEQISCATCHDPSKAFTDGRAVAVGHAGRKGTRNTPTLVNRGLSTLQFWDGRAASLEEQALGPIFNPVEMALPLPEAVEKLSRIRDYTSAFREAFDAPPTAANIAAALAAYQRTLFSVDAPFDRFIAGDEQAMTPAARNGLELFGGKAGCGDCHAGLNFTDERFHTLGVGGDQEPGRAVVTRQKSDRGAFKTPTLREVARTPPYMHDGSFATLGAVVEFYDQGCRPHPNLDGRIHKLGLTAEEKQDLVAFLESLSGRIVELAPPGVSNLEIP